MESQGSEWWQPKEGERKTRRRLVEGGDEICSFKEAEAWFHIGNLRSLTGALTLGANPSDFQVVYGNAWFSEVIIKTQCSPKDDGPGHLSFLLLKHFSLLITSWFTVKGWVLLCLQIINTFKPPYCHHRYLPDLQYYRQILALRAEIIFFSFLTDFQTVLEDWSKTCGTS